MPVSDRLRRWRYFLRVWRMKAVKGRVIVLVTKPEFGQKREQVAFTPR